ncbi:MAG: hypothetical protein GQ532_09965 [Methylomarinum sp.]|nr:hypothetical protein [Methylomarinum sp.]
MNCNCISEVTARLKSHLVENPQFKKPVVDVQLSEVAMLFGKGDLKSCTYTTLLITLEGQKKKNKTDILHSFCPFCGVKIEDNQPDALEPAS